MESNIDAYSVDELMKMFKLSDPLSEYEISSVMDIYKRSKKNSNIVAQRFIEAASKKLLDSVKIKTRHASTTYNYDAHSILMHLKQPKKTFTYELDSTPDYLNPTFQNTITRIINLDSKFREYSYPLLDPITGKDVTYKLGTKPIAVSPLKCLEPNKQSSTQYTAYLSDTLTGVLSLKLYNISIPYLWYNIDDIYGNNFFQYTDASTNPISIDRRKLSSITLPTGQYDLTDDVNNIYTAINDAQKKQNINVRFELDPLTRKTIINYYTSDYSGNYFMDEVTWTPYTILWYNILNITNQTIKANNNLGWKLGFRREISYIMNQDNFDPSGQPDLSGIPVYYIDFSNSFSPLGSSMYLETKEDHIFYNTDKTISYNPSQLIIYYKKEAVYRCVSGAPDSHKDWLRIKQYDHSMHNSPGNIMRVYPDISGGYIKKFYKYTAISDAPADLRLTKYLLLSIDDYNNNQLNSGLISIQSTEKNVKINSKKHSLKIAHCPDIKDRNYYQYNTGLSGDHPDILGITKAQVTSINAVAKLRSRPTNKTIAPTNSIFAIIRIPEDDTIKYGQTITNNDITLLNNERKYFGPITIGSLKIKLLTEDGYVINLNKIDWSFALLCKQLYQY